MARPEKQQSGKQQNKSKCQNVKTKQSIDELNAIQTTPLCCECGAIDRRISYLLSVKLNFVSETKLALWSKTFFFFGSPGNPFWGNKVFVILSSFNL
jgi:hypothetical protein